MSPRRESGRYFSNLDGPAHPNPFKRSTVTASHRGQKKFYAVRVGLDGFKGILSSWEECSLYVTGVKGAVFKSFKTYDQASSYIAASPNTQVGNNSGSSAANVSNSIPSTNRSRNPARRVSSEAGPINLIDDTLNPKYDPRAFEPSKLIVYTDGACVNNGKANAKAGVGVYFGDDSPYNISCRLVGPPTNQRAEIMAVLRAMQIVVDHGLIARGGILEIHTDSQYTKQGIEQWIDMWKRRGWKTTAKTDVKNKDLWEAVDAAKSELEREQVNLVLKWVKGHAGVPGNEAADRLAVRGIQGDW